MQKNSIHPVLMCTVNAACPFLHFSAAFRCSGFKCSEVIICNQLETLNSDYQEV